MITKQERLKLKEVLGSNYAPELVNFLKGCNIVKRDGQNYSAAMVRRVLNGYEHPDIEKAIIEFAAQKLEKAKAWNAKKAAILGL